MDWKKWKTTLRENYKSKSLSLGYKEIQKGKQILDKFVSENNQFILFDLETSGLTEDFLKKSKERQPEQITEIAGLVINLKLQDGKLSIEKGDNVDYFVELKDFVKARLDKNSEEYKKHILHKVNISIQKMNLKKPIPPLSDFDQIDMLPEQAEGFEWRKSGEQWSKKEKVFNVKNNAQKAYNSAINFDTTKVLELTKYYENEDKPKLDERQAIIQFLKFIKKYPNAVLSGQNIEGFDLKFLDQRMKDYNLGSFSQHNRKFFDTIHVARNILHPALEQMENFFSSKVEEINSQLQDQSNIDQELLENEDTEQVFSSIINKGEDFINSYPEEQRELAKLKFIFTVLLTKTKQTREELYNKDTKRYTSSQGPLSTVFRIKTDNWHNALADVEMLSGLFTSMYNLIDFATKYVGGALTEEIIQEMEPYQQYVAAKHPASKKRLTGHGKNKDKSSPYKVKLSYKRGKSAPPAG
jgi:DNA polymerase III epsilon subunit-like protein